ncbi:MULTISPECIES: hypothetical protein [Pseudomonas]|uniref:Uncharacterized protein n=1 Tax=Pseudomonas putida TaxID=303 RepID=A0A1L7N5Y7_PSEPU|nr:MULTISPECIES: hypothetical protein [Pseudomonas]RRV69307.1 hypothetical protein EGJ15_12380 [Pseudomonas sp. p99-361]MBP2085677.1 hypothetical protein [Pseudomonas sp. PvP089]MBP2088621.1 hypothetical protein [Pseudomonas sp. PvP088]MBP2225059.1 hypothetical protein [Pseudomonas putida]MCE1139889.1 hypothetical protein [Pseudomonas alloputida]
MVKKPNNAEETMIIVREAIRYIRGHKDTATWHHANVHGLISAFSIVGLLERAHIKRLNIEADDALERITLAHFPKPDI